MWAGTMTGRSGLGCPGRPGAVPGGGGAVRSAGLCPVRLGGLPLQPERHQAGGDPPSIAAVHFLSLKLTRAPYRLRVWLGAAAAQLLLSLPVPLPVPDPGHRLISRVWASTGCPCCWRPGCWCATRGCLFLLYALYQRTFGRCRPLRGLLDSGAAPALSPA